MLPHRRITLNSIYVPLDAPVPPNDKIEALMASMKEVGLLNPLTVQWKDQELCFYLIAGRTRFEAAKRLKWDEINVIELPPFGSAPDAEVVGKMARIAENAHRREIPETERAELIAEWIQLQKERKKAAKRQVAQLAPAVLADGRKAGPQHQASGIRAAARDLGLPRDTVRRAVRIASLSDAAKAEAKALGLDNNQSALLEAAKEKTPEKQVEALLNRTGAKEAAAGTGEAFRKSLIEEVDKAKREVETRIDEEFDARTLGYVSWEDAINAVKEIWNNAPERVRSSIRGIVC